MYTYVSMHFCVHTHLHTHTHTRIHIYKLCMYLSLSIYVHKCILCKFPSTSSMVASEPCKLMVYGGCIHLSIHLTIKHKHILTISEVLLSCKVGFLGELLTG